MEQEKQILLEGQLFRIVSLLIERGNENTKKDVTEEINRFCEENNCDNKEVIDILDKMMKARTKKSGYGPKGVKQYVQKDKKKENDEGQRSRGFEKHRMSIQEECLDYFKIVQKYLNKKNEEGTLVIDSNFVERYLGMMEECVSKFKEESEESIFQDAFKMNGLCGIDCTNYDLSRLTQEQFERIAFSTTTTFSKDQKEKFRPEKVLEKGKKFGLGLDKIQLTGKGINIAIIDQNFDQDTVDAEFVSHSIGRTVLEEKENIEEQHGKPVVSLLGSKDCGVAKGVKIYYFPSAATDAEKIKYGYEIEPDADDKRAKKLRRANRKTKTT